MQLTLTDRKITSQVYQVILQEDVRSSVCQLELKSQMIQQDSDLKQKTLNRQQKQHLMWPSPDLNLTEMLWLDLRRNVQTTHPKNIAELKSICKEETFSTLPQQRFNKMFVL